MKDENDSFVRDARGWVDDFRALPGECGMPLTRMIYAHALITQGSSFAELKKMGFSKDMISEVTTMMLEDEYDESR